MFFTVGEIPRLTFTVTNMDVDPEALADPDVVTLLVIPPTGDEVTYTYGVGNTIVKLSTGVYTAKIALTEKGRWFVRWNGTGTVTAVAKGFIDVESDRPD